MKLSVVIPTHNRPNKLAAILDSLKRQSLADSHYEIIVVDDGSTPAVSLPEGEQGPTLRLLRTEGVERSIARNRGAAIAAGDILLFVDDDVTVDSDFLAAHLRAHSEWPGCLAVGAVRLPDQSLAGPFGRFRQRLEQQIVPEQRGLTSIRNFCTASNMSISREMFCDLGGFDNDIVSSEDQDFALRHTARGGRITFLPEALALHHDNALDLRSYCRRAEWGIRYMALFCRRYPDWPDNIERLRVNGPVRLGQEPFSLSARKLFKSALSFRPIMAALFFLTSIVERVAPRSLALDRIYKLILGTHLLRGFRAGLIEHNTKRFEQDPVHREVGSLPELAAKD